MVLSFTHEVISACTNSQATNFISLKIPATSLLFQTLVYIHSVIGFFELYFCMTKILLIFFFNKSATKYFTKELNSIVKTSCTVFINKTS